MSRPFSATEDQILVDGINKYGIFNWHKIASLLARRTADECRARYRTVLSTREDDFWTNEQDEKLKKLVLMFPSMWQSIAASLGPVSAEQCMHRMEVLNGAKQPVKQAVVHHEDDKSVLNEANARLQNKLGRKAKRKLRERNQNDAAFLAAHKTLKQGTRDDSPTKDLPKLIMPPPKPAIETIVVSEEDKKRVKQKLSAIPAIY